MFILVFLRESESVEMPELAKPRTITLVLIVAVATVALVAVGSASSVVCGSCHAMQPYAQAASESPHTGVGCGTCHAESLSSRIDLTRRVFARMIPSAILGKDTITAPATIVSSDPCLECHEAVLDDVTTRNGMTIQHSTCTGPTGSCNDCHSAATHAEVSRWQRQPVMEECVICHTRESGPTDCESCHDGKLQTDRLARGPWQVTHGPEWRSTHGAGTFEACVTCHPPDYCARCHGLALPHPAGFGDSHGTQSQHDDATCLDCHDQKNFCNECHSVPMPHPADFLNQHPSIADGYEDESCLVCHREQDCAACHLKHVHPGSTRGTLGTFGVTQ